MENSFFIFTDNSTKVHLERFHVCTWEFDKSSLIEFGFEIRNESLSGDSITISILIPWLTKECTTKDLYDKLKDSDNSRFIFNDSIDNTKSLDGGINVSGVIHEFSERNKLCILPVEVKISDDQILTATLSLEDYQKIDQEERPNVYFRFIIHPSSDFISTRKSGISKSTIIYDIKINQKRNIPVEKVHYLKGKHIIQIDNCFVLNIIPNKYEIIFYDNVSLKNVRTLEYDSFKKYLSDNLIKEDELLVLFNKKSNLESFSFFSIFSKERIGTGQFALAILINIICGILLFIPSYRKSFYLGLNFFEIWKNMPLEIFIAIGIVIITILYFIYPSIRYFFNKINK